MIWNKNTILSGWHGYFPFTSALYISILREKYCKKKKTLGSEFKLFHISQPSEQRLKMSLGLSEAFERKFWLFSKLWWRCPCWSHYLQLAIYRSTGDASFSIGISQERFDQFLWNLVHIRVINFYIRWFKFCQNR